MDGKYYLVSGKVNTSTSQEYNDFEDANANNKNNLSNKQLNKVNIENFHLDYIYYRLNIQKGQKKTGSRIVPHKIGNHTYYSTQYYTYTDYTPILENTFLEKNFNLDGKIDLQPHSKMEILVNSTETYFYPVAFLQKMANLNIPVDQYNLDKAHKFKFTESIINKNDHITAFGEKVSKNGIKPICLGNSNLVHDFIKIKALSL